MCSDTDDCSDSSSIFSCSTNFQDQPVDVQGEDDNIPGSSISSDSDGNDNEDSLLSDTSSTSVSVAQHVADLVSDDGWDFSANVYSEKIFEDDFSLHNATNF